MEILFFLAGIAAVLLPSFFPVALALMGLFLNYSHRVLLFLMLGCLWGSLHQASNTPKVTFDLSRPLFFSGVIASLPKQFPNKTQFEFLIQTPLKARVSLTCYDKCPDFKLGQSWRMCAKMRTPLSYRNPGGFDYPKFLRSKHIVWTGFLKKEGMQLLNEHEQSFDIKWLQWRIGLSNRFEFVGWDVTTRGIVEALTLGLVHRLPQEAWDLFRRTGTTHLMVISGAHIGLVAGLVFKVVHFLWRFFGRLSAWIPAMRMARCVGVCVGFGYAFLAGFGVPARRAVWSFSALSLRYCMPIYLTQGQAWRIALWFVLLVEPHVVLQSGFYLSFMAVAILMLASRRFEGHWIKTTLLLQGACLLGLMPLTLHWFGYASLNGFFANLIAIPWVSFILIPFGLLSLIHPWSFLLTIEHQSVKWLVDYLTWIDKLAWINLTHVFPGVASSFLMLFSLGLLLLIPIRSLHMIFIFLWLSSWMPARSLMRSGEAEIDVLDVGQGLSVVVKTRHHTLIYDTGMKFYRGSDIGQLVLVPYLKKLGLYQVDKVVISHSDLDHRGGLESLQRAFQVNDLLVGNPRYYRTSAHGCHEAMPWVWDGVVFEFLPVKASFSKTNNHSCILKISHDNASILLTGDIEYATEHYLVEQYASKLRSSVLLVPHHGSKTSSSSLFLESVSPQWAVVSYGADNRYHFPHQAAMLRYFERKIPVYSTQDYGLIKIQLSDTATLKRSSWPYFFFVV